MVPEREKQSIMSVFGFKSLKFIIERIIFWHKSLKNAFLRPTDNFEQASEQKKNGRMLSWNLSKESINFKIA